MGGASMRTETKSSELRTKTLRVGLVLTILMSVCCVALSFLFIGNPRINLYISQGRAGSARLLYLHGWNEQPVMLDSCAFWV